MITYKFQIDSMTGSIVSIWRSDSVFIPLAIGNNDCANFLAEWKAGATVVNADGSPAIYSDATAIALGLTSAS
jgi:hypothetical protein